MNYLYRFLSKFFHALNEFLGVPVSANIIRGVKCTCFFSIKDDVINAGGIYDGTHQVVVDEEHKWYEMKEFKYSEIPTSRMLTALISVSAQVPTDVAQFMRAVLELRQKLDAQK